MMSHEQWLDCIITAAEHVASREYQEQAWSPGSKVVSTPEELYLRLMEDCTFELFFKTYGHTLTNDQTEKWKKLKSRLDDYYDKLPKAPDYHYVLDDPEWHLVRQAAREFVDVFKQADAKRKRV